MASNEIQIQVAFDTSQIKAAMRRFMDAVTAIVMRRSAAEAVDRITEEEARFLFAVPIDVELWRGSMNELAQARADLDQEIRSALTIPPQYLPSTGEGPPVWSGPTSACWDCGARVPPQDLWVGKKSGVGLCEGCMGRWEKAGRAKRSGDF